MFKLNEISLAIPRTLSTLPCVRVGLPPKGTSFRVHPELVLRNARVLYASGDPPRWYLLGTAVGDCAGSSAADLYVGIDSFGQLWVLVASLAGTTVVKTALEQAKTVWTRRIKGVGQVFEGNLEMGEVEPAWPDDLDLETLLNDGFGQAFYINDPQHPLIKPKTKTG